MFLFIILLSIWVCIKTISYGLFEIKENNNKFGGITVIVFSIIALILPIVTTWYQ